MTERGSNPGASCLFCGIASGERPADIVFAADEVLVFLDERPLFPGHCLVVPRAHVGTLPELPVRLVSPLFETVRRVAAALERPLGAQGSFVALNNRVSQSVPHLHVHVVPRRRGDGLKGFFWPRHPYAGEDERRDWGRRLREALAGN